MISPKELKELLTEEQICHILRRLGSSEFRDNGKYLSFKTVCHNIDEHEANFNLAYYKDTRLFRCFSECGETFDIYGLVKRRFQIEGEDIHRSNLFYFVLNYSDVDFDNYIEQKEYHKTADNYTPQPLRIELPEYSDHVMDVFTRRLCIEWLRDGITAAAMEKFNVKYSIGQNKIVIPHYDIDGRLIGIRGRALDEEQAKRYGKYAPIKVEQTLYSHPLGLNLYGLNINKDAINRTGIAILVESEKAVLQAESLLAENVTCAVCGGTFNRWQILQLIKYCNVKEIIVAFDREEKNNENRYFNRLYTMCKKYKQYCDFSFIYDNKLLKMKESPFDTNEEILNKLIKKRVRVK